MNFELPEEHRALRDMVREFAQGVIVPIAAEYDESGEFPVETVRQMGELGLMGIEIRPFRTRALTVELNIAKSL